MTNTLDPGYAAAAQRRSSEADAAHESSERPPRGPRAARTLALVATLAVLGVLLAASARDVRRSQPSSARAKAALLQEVRQRQRAVSVLGDDVAGLRRSTASLRADTRALSSGSASAAAALGRLGLATGARAVEGPGVRVRLDDAHRGAQAGSAAGRVQYTDLQLVVNSLWAAGAEAIAINDQRVTALTSIRSAGSGIVVDFRPVDPPYDVVAIGNPDTLLPAFVGGPVAAQLRTYSQVYGIGFGAVAVSHLVLPAASGLLLYSAVAGTPSAAPSSSATTAPTATGGAP